MTRVLIVEDDPAMSVALRDGFEFERHEVEMAVDGVEGFELASRGDHDLIILDVMLPRQSGLDVCRQLRSMGRTTPIIMLTARGQEIDKIAGLRLGADDYVTKPFSFLELMARVEAVLRRTQKVSVADTASFGDVTLDFRTYEAQKDGQPLDLTPREFRMLRYFLDHAEQVVTRDALLNSVWGYDSAALTRTVDTHIARLRAKIGAQHLVTVHRMGYKFVP